LEFGIAAKLYSSQSKYTEAEQLRKQVIVLFKNLWGEEPRNRDFAVTLDNLAKLYSSQGRHAEAKPLYQQALAIASKF
jgi:tetratricopeptide (TPR) repeat protein